VVPPQLASELADSLPEMATLVFKTTNLKFDFKTTKVLKRFRISKDKSRM
jgi:hypothetical protein